MWQKLQQWAQHKHTQQLGWAILISVLLHTWLFGGNFFTLPSLKDEYHAIEARLQMPKVEPPEPQPAPPKPARIIEPETEPVPVAQAPEPEPMLQNAPPVSEPDPPVQPSDPVPAQPVNEQPAEEPTPPPLEDMGLVINSGAYQYVESYFDVSTKIDGPSEGEAVIIYNLLDGMHYELTNHAKASGFAGFFLSNYVQESRGELTKAGLRPNSYISKYGDKADKTYRSEFDWQNGKLRLITQKGDKTEALPEGTQDLLSFMYQFMHVPPLQNMQIPITNGKKLKIYDYQFEGEESFASKLGEFLTVHISRTGLDPEDKMELWLAPQFQYIPVKIRKTEKDGKVYEMTANRIEVNRPTAKE